MSKKCDKCHQPMKPGAKEWFLYRGREILTLCSSGCHRAARDTITPPAPKPEPRDPNQQEAFRD